MKKLMTYSLSLLLCSALFVPQAFGVTKVATGGSGAATSSTFGVNGSTIQAHAFYKPLGAYFAGLSRPASANSVCYAERPAVDTAPTFSGITNSGTTGNGLVRGTNITAIDVVGNPTSDVTRRDINEVRILFLSSKGANNNLPVGVHCMTVTGGVPTFRSLVDAGGSNATTNTMTLVAGNQGTRTFGFAAVKDSAATSAVLDRDVFGATTGDGIACLLVSVTHGTNAMTQVTQKAFDIAATSSLVVRVAPLAKDMAVSGPAMCYDETLSRLYVGSGGVTSAPANGGGLAGVWGVGIYKVDGSASNVNMMSAMVKPTNETVSGNLTLTGSNIVGVKSNRATVAINKLRVMHTSTGPSSSVRFAYLIVNGGNGYINGSAVAGAPGVGNKVWAVPLVVGNATAANNGLFADVTTANFGSVAAAAGDLYLTNTNPVRVGNGPLPCAATSTPTDMWVNGDAVYCSIGGAPSNTNIPGVWYSQPYFDQHGKIAGWTEWAKAAPNELGDGVNDGGVGFIAVDAKTSRMWGVDNGTKRLLRMTNWQKTSYDNTAAAPASDTSGLLYNLNTSTNLGDGCTAVCDLNASTTAWGATTPQRIALFGGLDGKICFAKTGSGVYGSTQVGLSNPGNIITSHTGHHHQFTTANLDYSDSTTLLKTTVAGATGKTVTSLAYSGWSNAATPGFFFAGLEEDGGLYVWAKSSLAEGFNTRDDIRDFDADPFRTATGASGNYRSWQKLDRAGDGIPVKIVAEGGAVYILMRKGGASPADYIVRVTRKNTGKLLNTDFVTTASTGVSPLTNVSRIVDFVVSTSASGIYTGEQLTMLTNDGIYTTSSTQGTNGIVRDYDSAQTNAGWYQMTTPSTDGTAQFFMNQPAHTRAKQTSWFSRWVANSADTAVYNKNELYSLNRSTTNTTGGSAGSFTFAQDSINGYDLLAGSESSDFAQNDIFCKFYSDGSRRLFNKLSSGTYKLASRPFEVSTEGWDMSADHTSFGAAFDDVTYVYWISYVGDTGKLLAGTNKGVMGLV